MAIKPIQDLYLYSNLPLFFSESKRSSPFLYPIITLMEKHSFRIVASIRVEFRGSWYLKNVVAKDQFGPTIYKVLMELSGENGIAPSRKSDRSSPELISAKSRRIWRSFAQSPSVATTVLCDKYDDDVLNSKFVSTISEVDIESAIRNLKGALRDLYILKRGKQNRLLCLKRRYFNHDYRCFINDMNEQIYGNSKVFLEKSLTEYR